MKTLRRVIYKYKHFKAGELTRRHPFLALTKYVYINLLLYVFKLEYEFTFFHGLIKVRAKKGDSVVTNFHSVLHEPQDSLFLVNYLDPEDYLVDVGANTGHFSLLAATACKTKCLAFEPIPATFERLLRNIELNNLSHLITALQIGLADKEGKLTFSNDRYTTNRVLTKTSKNSIQVNVRRLDTIEKAKDCTVLKIDVEGFELQVLLGASKLLSSERLNVIIVELNGSSLQYDVPEETILSRLASLGFKPYRYDLSSNQLLSLPYKNEEGFNTIFVRDITFAVDKLKRKRAQPFS